MVLSSTNQILGITQLAGLFQNNLGRHLKYVTVDLLRAGIAMTIATVLLWCCITI